METLPFLNLGVTWDVIYFSKQGYREGKRRGRAGIRERHLINYSGIKETKVG